MMATVAEAGQWIAETAAAVNNQADGDRVSAEGPQDVAADQREPRNAVLRKLSKNGVRSSIPEPEQGRRKWAARRRSRRRDITSGLGSGFHSRQCVASELGVAGRVPGRNAPGDSRGGRALLSAKSARGSTLGWQVSGGNGLTSGCRSRLVRKITVPDIWRCCWPLETGFRKTHT